MKILPLLCMLIFGFCNAQTNDHSNLVFTSDLKTFESLSPLKEVLKDVEIIALGENTHGLAEVFKAKTELVKFLYQELGFNLILFESGFGDAALAWEQIDLLSTEDFTRSFSSNFYYQSQEIMELVAFAKSQENNLVIQGFDCQPQQNFLIKRMTEIASLLDSALAKSVQTEMRSFNKLYQFESENDTLAFYNQRDTFIRFINNYEAFLNDHAEALANLKVPKNELEAILATIDIFRSTYSHMEIGEMMGWPAAYDLRDKAMFQTVQRFKAMNPESKIIIWAQNSHIENKSKPDYNVNWMGHSLKSTYGDKYYSIGSVVYSGKNMNYNGMFDFEHKDETFLAYYLNQFQKERFVFNLRQYNKNDFTQKLLLGMENNGNTAAFIAKDRFDALLFIQYSDVPTLLLKE